MVGLVPFNRRSKDVAASTGFGDFYNVLDDFFSNDWPFRRSLANDTFKVDVQDNDNEYLIEAEMPGVDKKDINVALDAKHGEIEPLARSFRASCAHK